MIDLDALVAHPNVAPVRGQSRCPDRAYSTNRIAVQPSPEITRVAALPRRSQPSPADEIAIVEALSARLGYLNPRCRCEQIFRAHGMVDPDTDRTPECITKLRPVQAWALLEIATFQGLLGAVGVGHGKTIVDLLTPMVMPNCRTAVLLVPPGLVKQLMRDWEIVGQHFKMPTLIAHDAGAESRIVDGAPTVHIYPYSLLSRPENSDYLERVLKPDTIIADECHKLKSPRTATASRFLRYLKAHPETRFVALSGSILGKSIKDVAHLARHALREGSPFPRDDEGVEDWARAIDPSEDPAPMGALEQFCAEGEHIHEAFHRRLVETPGVVATRAAAVDATLEIIERAAPAIPTAATRYEKSVSACLSLARYKWIRPDGEPLPDAFARVRCLIQIACGFFYRWRFPLIKGVPQNTATILEWLETRSAWCKEVRTAIRSRREHFDSEALARNAAERAWGDRASNGKLPVWRSTIYRAWRDIEDQVVHETEAIWIDDYLARDAAEWGLAHRGIIWYLHDAFGERVAKLSKLELHRGGPRAGDLLAKASGKQSIICAIKSHGTGRDGLQFKFHDQLVANPGSSNEEWEQLLGRTHRVGQRAPIVRTAFYRHTPELMRCVNNALRRAGFVDTVTGSDQKLILSGLSSVEPEEDDDSIDLE